MIGKKVKFDWFAKIIIFILAVVIGVAYLYRWDIGYSSDNVLTGIAAKKILEFGDQAIFVWKVGYQGLLLESNVAAVLFKLFGLHPRTLFLTSFVFFIPLVFVFFWITRLYFNRSIAFCASLFLLISSPHVYIWILRTIPNYTETFLMGLLIFGIYHLLLREHLSGKPLKPTLLVAIGVIAGFGAYTYQQIFYFILAIFLHLFLFLLRNLHLRQPNLNLLQLLVPICFVKNPHLRRTLQVLYGIFFSGLAFGIYEVLLDSRHPIHGIIGPARTVLIFVVAIFGVSSLTWIWEFRKSMKNILQNALPVVLGFLIGNSPKLYFKYVLHGRAKNHLTVNGGLSDFLRRFDIALDGNLNFLNLDGSIFSWIIGSFLLAAFVFYLFQTFRQIKDFVFTDNAHQNRSSILGISPIAFLPFVIIPAFCISARVIDSVSARYSVSMIFFYATASGYSLMAFLNWARPPKPYRWIPGAIAAAILLFNSFHIWEELRSPFQAGRFEDAAQILDKRNIRHGYGGYWIAYGVTFLTNERIILEPTFSNYAPYYAVPVSDAPRIAVVLLKDRRSFDDQFISNLVQSGRYRKAGFEETSEIEVHFLEKVANPSG